MSFRYAKIYNSDDWEVIMEAGTHFERGKQDRRLALCTHENDAEAITECLNNAEKLGILRQ